MEGGEARPPPRPAAGGAPTVPSPRTSAPTEGHWPDYGSLPSCDAAGTNGGTTPAPPARSSLPTASTHRQPESRGPGRLSATRSSRLRMPALPAGLSPVLLSFSCQLPPLKFSLLPSLRSSRPQPPGRRARAGGGSETGEGRTVRFPPEADSLCLLNLRLSKDEDSVLPFSGTLQSA